MQKVPNARRRGTSIRAPNNIVDRQWICKHKELSRRKWCRLVE